MIRIEAFILLGFLLGVAAVLAVQWIYRKVHAVRERRMVERARREALKVRIDQAPTSELLDEIATRDDLTESRSSWEIDESPRPLVRDKTGRMQPATSRSIFRK